MASLLAALGPLAAQQPRPAGRGGVTIAFLAATKFENGAQAVLRAGEEWRSEPFDVPVNHLGQPVGVAARALILEAANREVGRITLPEEGRTFVAILVPAAEKRWRALVVRTDDGTFRPGDLFIYNGSPTMVGGTLGTEKFALASGKSAQVRPKAKDDLHFFDVNLYFRQGEKTRVMSTTRWPVDDRSRGYVFFFTDPKSERITYRAVDEFVPPPPASGGGAGSGADTGTKPG